ncbi:large ribosomal subunit protein mL61 [Trichomonascus vanleenenianus]|uniref:mitochondrial 54S ribosomal protein mL61 MRP49 n=1 Tax=Trichomonascus vanleenenianus TaxID=2268995 RepID=UPI003ECA9591
MSSSISPRVAAAIRQLNAVSKGPGSITLPTTVNYLRLSFREKNRSSIDHGAVRFWKKMLPRVQFHNPQLPIAVTKYTVKSGRTPTLQVHFADGSKKVLDVSKKNEQEILKQLIQETEATVIPKEERPEIKINTLGM